MAKEFDQQEKGEWEQLSLPGFKTTFSELD